MAPVLAWKPYLLMVVKFRSVIREARRLLVLDWNLKETSQVILIFVFSHVLPFNVGNNSNMTQKYL